MSRHPHLIILANQSLLWRTLLRRLLDKTPGMIVLDDSGNFNELPSLLRQVQVDWLVVTRQENGGINEQARMFVQRASSLSLLAISADGGCWDARFQTPSRELHRCQFHGAMLTKLLSILSYKSGDVFPSGETTILPSPTLTRDLPIHLPNRIAGKIRVR
jgi:hypothetical protein